MFCLFAMVPTPPCNSWVLMNLYLVVENAVSYSDFV